MNKRITLICSLLSLTLLSGCNNGDSVKMKDYNDYEHVLVKDYLKKGNLKDKESDTYYIYLYRTQCGTCEKIKHQLFKTIDKGLKTGHKIYLSRYERINENPNNDVLKNLTRFKNENSDKLNSYYDMFSQELTEKEKSDLIKNVNDYTSIVINDLKEANKNKTKIEDITYFFTPSIYEINVNKNGVTSNLKAVENTDCESYLKELEKNW